MYVAHRTRKLSSSPLRRSVRPGVILAAGFFLLTGRHKSVWARLGSSGANTVARHQEGADPAREYTSTPARHEWPISAATKPSRVSVHALTRPRGWGLPGSWGGPGKPVSRSPTPSDPEPVG